MNRLTNQQTALLGIALMIRGLHPRKNPPQPYRCLIIRAATQRPLAERTVRSLAVPRVWSRVLITSRGVVKPAATPPANPPATQWVIGS